MNPAVVAERYSKASEEARHLVDRLLAQDADDRAWSEQLGPAYRQADVARLLRKSKQAVSADSLLLKLTMRNGDVGYPVFQFDGGRQLAGIRDVVAILTPVVVDSWTTASWLMSPSSDIGDVRPLDRLRDGDVEPVVAMAYRLARALVR